MATMPLYPEVAMPQYPVAGRPSATTYYPSYPVTVPNADNAADALDAADGVMDGKYFGMKILAPTRADPYSPSHSFGGIAATTSYSGSVVNNGMPTTSYIPSSPGGAPVTVTNMVPSTPGVSGGILSSPAITPGAPSTSNGSMFPGISMAGGPGMPFTSNMPLTPSAAYGSSMPIATSTLSPGGFPGTFMSDAMMGTSISGSGSYTNAQILGAGHLVGSPLSNASLNTGLPPVPVPSGPYSSMYPGTSSFMGGTLGSSLLTSMPFLQGLDVPSPSRPMEGNSTINISTGWEKAVDELKKELETLKSEGGMAALRELLQMKVDELEKCRQSEMVKEKELHRLQDMYAEEIRKHTEDLAKVRKAESDLAAMKQTEGERLRLLQEQQERDAAAALAKLEQMRLEQEEKAKSKKVKKVKKVKKAKKAAKSPIRR